MKDCTTHFVPAALHWHRSAHDHSLSRSFVSEVWECRSDGFEAVEVSCHNAWEALRNPSNTQQHNRHLGSPEKIGDTFSLDSI